MSPKRLRSIHGSEAVSALSEVAFTGEHCRHLGQPRPAHIECLLRPLSPKQANVSTGVKILMHSRVIALFQARTCLDMFNIELN